MDIGCWRKLKENKDWRFTDSGGPARAGKSRPDPERPVATSSLDIPFSVLVRLREDLCLVGAVVSALDWRSKRRGFRSYGDHIN